VLACKCCHFIFSEVYFSFSSVFFPGLQQLCTPLVVFVLSLVPFTCLVINESLTLYCIWFRNHTSQVVLLLFTYIHSNMNHTIVKETQKIVNHNLLHSSYLSSSSSPFLVVQVISGFKSRDLVVLACKCGSFIFQRFTSVFRVFCTCFILIATTAYTIRAEGPHTCRGKALG
jgi:succinate dehydrogenase hydrophobic anchor subunit